MALASFSKFYYGLNITTNNQNLDFDEGGGELTAVVPAGTYDFASLLSAIVDAMNSVGANTYTAEVARSTRIITISATASFDLLLSSGSNQPTSIFSLLGFNQGADQTGTDEYSGDTGAGFEYRPQFILQDYQDPETHKERVDASVNEAASGAVEVISFGLVRFITMSIKFITNLSMDGKVIRNNPNGLDDAVDFLTAITERGVFEFIPDVADSDTFYTVQLDEISGSKTGTGFKLKELTNQSLPNIYEIDDLKMRVIE